MPVFNIHHVTKYEYDRPVKESVNEIRIYPFGTGDQEVLFHELNITGNPDVLLINDYWGNRAGMFNLMASHKQMVIESKLIVRTLGRTERSNTPVGFDVLRKEIGNNLSLLELSYLQEVELREKIKELGKDIYDAGNSVMETVER